MATINWTDSMSVKIESIDNQHKKLFSLINDFYDQINSNDKQDNLVQLIKGLQAYTVYHFNKEETIMKKLNYPEYDEHKKEHELFISHVNDYVERIKAGKLIISIEITNFVKKWLVDHISKTDKKYSDFFIKNGVS